MGFAGHEQCQAKLEEFGFSLVDYDTFGAPTAGRIADRLADIHRRLESALRYPIDVMTAVQATAELRRLRLALDYWDGEMTRRQVP